MKPLLECRALSLRAGRRMLIDGLSLAVSPGELWCVLGRNGSGKTTLLHTLAGLAAPAAGTIRLGDRALADWSPGEAACLRGLVPQALHDAFGVRVLDLVLMGRHPYLGRWTWESDADRAIARAALAVVEMSAQAERDVTTLSGGERQRVAIAALLAQDPLLLLLDEPVAHLDLRHQIEVLGHLRELARERGKAVIVSIHDINLARRFATHALVLSGDATPPVHGPVDAAMTEATLGAAFGHPVARTTVGERTVFVAD